jgi:DNA-binding NtrC family response regulator
MDRICFIDDDAKFEIPLFREVFADAYDIITATGYENAKRQIDERTGWKPDLFVLDLYFPEGEADRDAIAALMSKPPEAENDRADIRTAYSNYLRAEDRLRAVLSAYKQGPKGGLKLAGDIAQDFPNTPIVFYSRKATFEDVVNCMACNGVRWVEKKPTAQGNDEDTRDLTFGEKDRLVQRFNMVIADRTPKPKSGVSLQAAAKVILEMIRSMF